MESLPRSLQLFELSIKSEKTLKLYKAYLKKFMEWAHKDHESLLLLPNDELQRMLEDYVLFLRKSLGYSAINVVMSAIGKFLEINDREYKQNKIRMLKPEKKKPEGKQAYATKQIQKMLEYADTLRDKAIIHCLSAGDFRDGAPNFHKAYMKQFWSVSKPNTKHISSITLKGQHNNNKMERMNGEIRDREKVMRGLKKDDTPIIEGYHIYHNYIRNHQALDGKTPADIASIKIEGQNKWKTLIENASVKVL
jgi:hypothetical protein